MMMTYTPTTDEAIVGVSQWVDEASANQARDSEARTWGRLSKVAEECGEVIAAYIGVTGQNPRKGAYGSMDDVAKELLDVAATALCAYVHVTRDEWPMDALREHVIHLYRRAGLDT